MRSKCTKRKSCATTSTKSLGYSDLPAGELRDFKGFDLLLYVRATRAQQKPGRFCILHQTNSGGISGFRSVCCRSLAYPSSDINHTDLVLYIYMRSTPWFLG